MSARPALLSAYGACVALAASGCSPAPIDLGQDPDFVFYTDYESGDLGAASTHGTTWENAGGTLDVVNGPARSGKHAARSTIVTQAVGTQSAALLIAEHLPDNAYFSAWFYLPEAVPSAYYWTLFKLASESATSTDPSPEIWVFDLDPDPAGATLRLYSDVHPDVLLDHPPHLPVARWFQIEAFVTAPTPDEGELSVWVDGSSILEYRGATMPTRDITWVIGSGAEGLGADAASLYIDDAAVTRRRLGPDFPAFWRAP